MIVSESTTTAIDEPAPGAVPSPRPAWAMVLRAIQVRLRFVLVLLVAFLVVGQWETLLNYWDWLTRGARPEQHAVSSDTEYFCPMDPGVVSDWPGKCGICNMGLVRRKRGESVPLPSGVVARMQISPFRLQLAGIQTSPVGYQPLAREISAVGLVTSAASGSSRAVAETELFPKDFPLVTQDQDVRITTDGQGAFSGRVGAILADPSNHRPRVRIEIDDARGVLRSGTAITARILLPISEVEPFRSMPADPPPLHPGEPRALFVCPEHPETLHEQRGRCTIDRKDELESRSLLANQRVGWWCPMHPTVVADRPGSKCQECGGMGLVPRIVTFRPSGEVLSVPESAVVDTGTRTVVYVERMPGMFDGVEVVLGPRCGDAYPVIKGLEPGQRVATAGAFLIDAETRLNPSLAASYFGAGRGSRAEEPADVPPLPRPSTKELCPVTGKPLGSMGPPVRVVVAGRTVLICCEGCEEKLRKDPEKYLSKGR